MMEWRKSSFSGSGGNCVQIRQDLAAIRDSKNGAELAAAAASLVAAAKSGNLRSADDRL